MSEFLRVVLLVSILVGGGVQPAGAHHSFPAEFDRSRPGELTGTIVAVWYKNPHARYRMRVSSDDGSFVEWDIQTDGRDRPQGLPPSSMGFSVGHWEDDVLVIETSNLTPGTLDGSLLPMSGEGTRVVERWALSEDRLALDRTMTIHDPYYSRPLVRRRGSARRDSLQVFEPAPCDPDGFFRDLLESGRLEQHLGQ